MTFPNNLSIHFTISLNRFVNLHVNLVGRSVKNGKKFSSKDFRQAYY